MSGADAVTVAIEIAVTPATAFAVFTEELDAWWQRGPRYRFLAPYEGVLWLEPGVGGRLLHARGDDRDDAFEVGRVRVWDPPHRLVFSWRLPNFTTDQVTEVEICFERIGEGTRLTLTHRGWDRIPTDHPARHGQVDRAFVLFRGRWWADLLGAAKRRAEQAHHRIDATGGRS
jgi:uncharacterized protein YndB with AHSA1/START domain